MSNSYAGEEALYWIDERGVEYLLGTRADKTSYLASWGGFDISEIEHVEQRLPQYHGARHRGFRYLPRTITVGLYRVASNRAGVWDSRQDLIQRVGLFDAHGSLKYVYPTNAPVGSYSRQIDCYIAAPMEMGSEQQRTSCSVGVVLQFVAKYPFWYDPTERTVGKAFQGATLVDLVYHNQGDWYTQPTFTIYPPASYPQIRLHGSPTSYLLLRYDVTAASGPVVITMTPEGERALDSYGVDITWAISKDSDLFQLPPGVNVLQFAATYGGTGSLWVSGRDWFRGI